MKFLSHTAVLLCLVSGISLFAQTAPAKSTSCKANTNPPSAAQIAMERGKYESAAKEFASERASKQTDSRLHAMEIRNLIAWGKVSDAEKDSTAWLAASPNDSYALISAADVKFRKGNLAESFADAARIQKLDPCNPRVYETLGGYESVIGRLAAAKRHIDLAHALDPHDAEITRDWVSLQPDSTRIAAARKFVETSPIFTEERRKKLFASFDKEAEHAGEEDCRLVSGQKQATIPFIPVMPTPDSDPLYGVELSFNGKKRRLELDSGASGITLSAASAQYLGLKVEESSKISGIGSEGSRDADVAYVPHLKIGDLEFSHCEVEILRSKSFGNAYSGNIENGMDGLIGPDIFQKFLVTLDYPGGEIKLSQLPLRPGEQPETEPSAPSAGERKERAPDKPLLDAYRDPSMEKWTPFYRFGHDIVVPTQLNAGPVKLMIADTGAHTDLIAPDAAREVTTVSTTEQLSVGGISGQSKRTYLTGKITLHFGGLYLPLPWMTAADPGVSNFVGTEISGFIGYPTLRQMTFEIDYRDRLLHFSYDPKRKYNPKFQPKCYVGDSNCKHFGG